MTTQNIEMALNTLKFLHLDGGVFELCLINPLASTSPNWTGRAFGKKAIVAGWFRDAEKAADLATRNEAEGIYTTLNRCNEALLARADQRLKANMDRTGDDHIDRIQNLLIDIDVKRPAGTSSTDQEHQAALEMAQIIRADLEQKGWSEPLVGDSGNGSHLIYPLDLPNSEEVKNLLKGVLKALAQQHQDHLERLNLEIDQRVSNPARLTKIYGTWVKKGDNTQDRPHRLARIISLPNARQPVPLELLKKLTAIIQSPENPQPSNSEMGDGRLDVEAYLRHYGVEVVMVKPHGGGFLYCLRECLFDPSHSGNEAAIGQTGDGKLYYQCFHNSCKARTWAEARARISGHDKLTEFIIGGTHSKDSEQSKSKNRQTEAGEANRSETLCPPPPPTPWNLAAQLFPRIPFPWEVLPGGVADSLQQLGRSCATSPYALPGAGFCLMASIMGRVLVVSPKDGWDSLLNTWYGDIRESGEGKTPPARLMASPLHEAQMQEEIRYREAMEAYKRLPKKERDQQPPPTPPRGYFVSDLTLEGLRDDLVNSPHGGLVVIQDELSAFLTAQNQYKPRGTDREAWLALWDGHPARIVRAGRTMYLHGARVSIFGGVQPKVFRKFFAGEDGLYLSDGTLFRFLLTFEAPAYHDLTQESWPDRDREKWEVLLQRAMDWVNGKISDCGGRIDKSTRMIFSSEAQTKFFDWRNQIYAFKDLLPPQFRGFIPKAVEYALRLTGIIHCMHMFSLGMTPQAILTVEDLERGIETVSFYLGQVQGALRLIEEEDYSPPEISERSVLLAQTLDQLRPHIQDGRLAVGFIHKHYNLVAPKTQRIGKPKGMGAVLRAAKLAIPPGKYDANGHRGVKCLEWNKQTEIFIKESLQSPQRQKSQEWQGIEDADVDDPLSAMSAVPSEESEDFIDLRERMPEPEIPVSNGLQDNADIADVLEVEI